LVYKNTESRDLHLGNENTYNLIEDRLNKRFNLEKKENTAWNNKEKKMNPKYFEKFYESNLMEKI